MECDHSGCRIPVVSVNFSYNYIWISIVLANYERRAIPIYVNIYSRFFPNFHQTIIESLIPWESQLLVSCIMSPVNLKFQSAFCSIIISSKSQASDRQTAGVQHLYRHTSVLRPLGGAATMRARCWCFALCEDSGVLQCMLFQDTLMKPIRCSR